MACSHDYRTGMTVDNVTLRAASRDLASPFGSCAQADLRHAHEASVDRDRSGWTSWSAWSCLTEVQARVNRLTRCCGVHVRSKSHAMFAVFVRVSATT